MKENTPNKTPIITLEVIAQRKAEKLEEVQQAKKEMVQTIHELFAPVEQKGGVEGIMQHINTGIAVYDGVRTGIKIMQRIRGYFLKKRNNLVLTTTFYPHEKTATRCGGNFVVIFHVCTGQSIMDALLCHFSGWNHHRIHL